MYYWVFSADSQSVQILNAFLVLISYLTGRCLSLYKQHHTAEVLLPNRSPAKLISHIISKKEQKESDNSNKQRKPCERTKTSYQLRDP